VCKTIEPATVNSHYKTTNRYVIGTKAKPLDFDVVVVVDLLSGNFPRCRWVIVLVWWWVSGSTVCTVEWNYCGLCSLCQIVG